MTRQCPPLIATSSAITDSIGVMLPPELRSHQLQRWSPRLVHVCHQTISNRSFFCSQLQKLLHGKPRFFNDRFQRSFLDIHTRMIWNCSSSLCDWIIPDFMTSLCLYIKNESRFPQLPDNISCSQGWQSRHAATLIGILTS